MIIRRKILITGGAGFIGSHCIQLFLKKYPDYLIVNLDKLTYAANVAVLQELQGKSNYHFVKGDIADSLLVSALFYQFNFDGIIHFAAESHVDRSIADPLIFIKTNIEGTAVLLHAAYMHWFEKPGLPRKHCINNRFLYISTDEVYGELKDNKRPFSELAALAPTNPYSASKASGEFLVKSYGDTYGLNTVITRSTNNYGVCQYPEKLIPMIIGNALQQKAIALHGNGSSIRDWLHVEDNCKAIDLIFHKGKKGQVYNIGANTERSNIEITLMICHILDNLRPLKNDSYTSLITFISERAGQDRRYALNCTKITKLLGWQPSISLQMGMTSLIHSQVAQIKFVPD